MPAIVALIGIAISVVFYSTFAAAETLDASDHLADTGRELARVSEDLEAIALEQVLAVQGLYESSLDVTEREFDHFVGVIGEPSDNQLAYAHRVPADGLNFFLARTRRSQPGFSFTGDTSQPTDVYWPLLHSSETAGVGYETGFDFGSDPTIRAAIETAFRENHPVAASFVEIPGDDTVGDFAIIAPIRRNGTPVGIGVVTLRIDELLTERVLHLLGNTARFSMTGVVGSDDPPVQTAARWVDTFEVVDKKVRLVLELADVQATTGSAQGLLVLGTVISLLAGGLIYDGSRRRSMTRQLIALQETLTEKDRFLASVSHELRTPLTAVVGIVEILASRIDHFDREDGELIQDVRSSTQELEKLVEDHLTSARLTAGALSVKRDQVDLNLLVARVIAVTDRPHRLTIRISELGACTGDAIRIRQIVRNLLDNAYRHAVSKVEIRANDTIGLTVIEVLNDGIPVSRDMVGTMFEPFVKGPRPGQPESIGLGLSVSRALAQRMGGDLIYAYEDGKVRFSLSLPAAPSQPQAAALAVAGPVPG